MLFLLRGAGGKTKIIKRLTIVIIKRCGQVTIQGQPMVAWWQLIKTISRKVMINSDSDSQSKTKELGRLYLVNCELGPSRRGPFWICTYVCSPSSCLHLQTLKLFPLSIEGADNLCLQKQSHFCHRPSVLSQ